MKRDAFRAWLRARSNSEKGGRSRTSAVSRIERILPELGLPYSDLDEGFEADRLAAVRKAMTDLLDDAKAGGTRFRILLPKSENAASRLSIMRSNLGQYRAFRESETATGKDSGWPELEAMRAEFLIRAPDFVDFTQEEGTYYEGERGYKDLIRAKIVSIITSEASDTEAGQQITRALIPTSGPILQWQALNTLEQSGQAFRDRFHAAVGHFARHSEDTSAATDRFIATLTAIREEAGIALTKGAILNIALSIAGFVQPDHSAPFKIEKARGLARRLGQVPFDYDPIRSEEITSWLELLRRIFRVMRDDWNWHPRDLFDVQGFAWMVLDDGWKPADEDEDMEETSTASPTGALNTILYGPPGTGKTFQTTRRAVAICDGEAEASRLQASGGLKARYEDLREAGRIGFVTFHQSFSYEDFVEGLRPEPSETGAGFGLEARPGILRQMASLAAGARLRATDSASLPDLRQRGVFKMSLGIRHKDDTEQLYQECLAGNYILLFWGGAVDWSAPQFSEWSAIRDRWQQEEPDANGLFHNASCLHSFRNDMQTGDLVILSDSQKSFRAIGEVTGPYEYLERAEDRFHHRRQVRWLWHETSLPASQITDTDFAQRTIYRIPPAKVKFDALAAYLAPAASVEHPPHVLIIDEINRANISRVFGELITLLEEDKRQGADHAISLTLPYSGDSFSLPGNLHILGTMNTADRSIALLDTALRRRFHFVETPPEPDRLGQCDGIDLALLLTRLNERIEYLFDRDHLIGHAFFMACKTREDVDTVMRRKVIPLLTEYFHEDQERIIAILGGADQGFIRRDRLMPPPGLEAEGSEDRCRYSLIEPFGPDAYAGLQM